MSQRFKDKTAIVTGSGGGIGRGIARLFHKEGGNVVISDIDEKCSGHPGEIHEAVRTQSTC